MTEEQKLAEFEALVEKGYAGGVVPVSRVAFCRGPDGLECGCAIGAAWAGAGKPEKLPSGWFMDLYGSRPWNCLTGGFDGRQAPETQRTSPWYALGKRLREKYKPVPIEECF